MKIDDPQVQAYIQGKLTSEEEIQFRELLGDHPEVADLAEMLKRASSHFLEEQQVSDESQNQESLDSGLDLTKQTAKKIFEDNEVPEAAWAKFFHSLMGKSWRFGVLVLIMTFVGFLIAFIVVPILRSYDRPSEKMNSLSDIEKQVKENRRSGGGSLSESDRKISPHAMGENSASNKMAEAFSQMMDPSRKILSATDVELLSEMAKVSSLRVSPDVEHFSLPVGYETLLQDKVVESILESKKWEPEKIQVDAFVNSYFTGNSSNSSREILVRSDWRAAPWDKKQILLMVEIQAPKTNNIKLIKPVHFIVMASQPSRVQAKTIQLMDPKSKIDFSVVSDFKKELLPVMERILQSGKTAVFLADESLTSEQADYLLVTNGKFSELPWAFISLNSSVNETHMKIRSSLLTENKGQYFSAATPTQLSRALRAVSIESLQFFNDFRWDVQFKSEFVKQPQLVGAIDQRGEKNSLLSSNWMMSGDRVVAFFLLNLNETQPSDEIGRVSVSFRLPGQREVRSLKYSMVRDRVDALLDENTFIYASSLIWTGLMLKGDLKMSKHSLKQIIQKIQVHPTEEQLQIDRHSFERLLKTLVLL